MCIRDRYKTYFSLFNDGGALEDIESAESNMIRVLREELSYLAQKQLFSTLLFIVAGTLLLPKTALGFTAEMLGIYRVLCVGYALYCLLYTSPAARPTCSIWSGLRRSCPPFTGA